MLRFYPICLIVFLFSKVLTAQIVIQQNDTSYCQPQPLTFNALLDTSLIATGLIIVDDTYSDVINLGFDFNFYGNVYNQCILSTNNYICFNTSDASAYSPWPINTALPSTAAGSPKNSVFGPWHDTDPSAGTMGTMSYKTFGEAPNRKFIYSLCEVPMYSSACNALLYSGQIVLYEGSNKIETHIANKPICPTWNTGQAIHGLHNSDGTVAHVVPGRNFPSNWTTTDEGYEFVPDGSGGYTINQIPYNPYLIYSGGSVTWYENNTMIGNGLTLNVPNPSVGTHQYVAKLEGCYGTSGSDTVTVTIGATDATYTQFNLECPEATDGFAAVNFSGSQPYDLVWTDTIGTILQSSNGTLGSDTLFGVGVGVYNLEITDGVGCVTNQTYTITAGIYLASFDYSPIVICQEAPVTFNNTSTETITAINWNFGDGDQATNNPTSHSFENPGNYSVSLTIQNTNNGCSAIDTKEIVVNANAKADFSVTSNYCQNDPVNFTDLSTPNPVDWTWYMSDLDTFDFQNPGYSFGLSGDYIITLTVVDSLCGTDTKKDTIRINEYPIVGIVADTLVCAGQEVTLDAGNPNFSHTWSTGDTTQFFTTSFQTTTNVWVIVTNEGCIDGDTITITINCDITMPTGFTPNADGKNDKFRPRGKNVISYDLIVFNRWGNIIYSETDAPGDLDNGWDGTINGEPAEIGTYVYYLKSNMINDFIIEKSGNVTLLR